jgi:hypothetical protein
MPVTLRGSGQVPVQVISTIKTDVFTSATTNAWVDITGLTVSITPSSASNRILVNYTVATAGVNGTSGSMLRVVRDSTPIGVGTTATGNQVNAGIAVTNTDNNWSNTCAQIFIDSPATTSATTYKIQGYLGTASGGTLLINRTAADLNAAYIGRFASSITVMEISG